MTGTTDPPVAAVGPNVTGPTGSSDPSGPTGAHDPGTVQVTPHNVLPPLDPGFLHAAGGMPTHPLEQIGTGEVPGVVGTQLADVAKSDLLKVASLPSSLTGQTSPAGASTPDTPPHSAGAALTADQDAAHKPPLPPHHD